MSALARRIQRASRLMAAQDYEALAIPPFVAFIDHVVAVSFFSRAVPEDGARRRCGGRRLRVLVPADDAALSGP